MNREHSSLGYKVVADTAATLFPFYGFTVLAEAVVSAIVAPTVAGQFPVVYDGDEAGLAGKVLPVGYYAIRGSSITLASGSVILWKE